ncbi:unnamed protein product [Didymodactylos carnosus]|uniref:Reverse transcriptase/retrotransposon-derived protein RNase H-like domain-containing protein n=1 Tax=Didymodactylos carnosus TaxID=1234261 RepID=A0A815PZT0_9BILA|nr:unnamed protein product [Didymodactylos carnosus]CAF4328217.1 unnamed protein product [Didymodactylos carnosus]
MSWLIHRVLNDKLIIDELDPIVKKYGITYEFQHHIDVGNSKPIKQGPYRLLNPEKKTACVKQTAEMFEAGICEPSFGPWVSPVTLVPKKDSTLRFCVDFRKVNEITVKDTSYCKCAGIRPDPEKSEAVRSFPIPGKAKDARAFLGLTGYYRRFIKNYAEVAESLSNSIREKYNPIFAFTPECQQAFELLKQRLISAPIVAYPNFDYPFLLQLDACDYGLGAVPAQNIDGIEHVIAYASRTLQSCERKYSASERECLDSVWDAQHFRSYLEGRPFEVWTDHIDLCHG